jgi:hypothetical protein
LVKLRNSNVGLKRLNVAGDGGHILLRHDALRTPQQTAHVVLHEVTHAATMRALVENPQIHTHVANMMRGAVVMHWRSLDEENAPVTAAGKVIEHLPPMEGSDHVAA